MVGADSVPKKLGSGGINTFNIRMKRTSGSAAYTHLYVNFDDINSLSWETITGSVSNVGIYSSTNETSTHATNSLMNSSDTSGTFDTSSITGYNYIRVARVGESVSSDASAVSETSFAINVS